MFLYDMTDFFLLSGWTGRITVWTSSMSICGGFTELAHPEESMLGTRQTVHLSHRTLHIRSSSIRRQLCTFNRLRVWLLPVVRFPAIHHIQQAGQEREDYRDYYLPDYGYWFVCAPYCFVLCNSGI